MSDGNDWVRLGEYLAGRLSPVERAAVEHWAGEAPENARTLAEARTIWARAGALPSPLGEVGPADVRRAWEALAARLDATAMPVSGEPGRAGVRPGIARRASGRSRQASLPLDLPAGPRPRHRGVRVALRAAAVIAIAGGGALVARGVLREPAPSAAPPVVREIATARGERADIKLDDGSRVVLGVDSRLRWPQGFDRRQRDVELDGEALFVVTHEAARPFVVRTGGAVIRDIGTEFGVRSYADDETVRVAVRSGRVMVAPAHDTSAQHALVGAGDVATVAADGALRVQHGADVERELAFADGRLIFVDTPMREVARRLARWYDVQVIVGDSLAGAHVSGTFERDAELSAVLRVLGASLGARVERRGRTVQFDIRR